MTKISVEYGRPTVKEEKVFGELVPFGQVWRAGPMKLPNYFWSRSAFGGQKVKKEPIVCSSSRKRMENHLNRGLTIGELIPMMQKKM